MEYDGTNYYGFQWQADRPTIQSETESAIFKLTGEKSRVIGASRTDTGVHAKGQVTSFRTESTLPVSAFESGLNHYLPEEISVKEAREVDSAVDVRREAVRREYQYHILNSRTRSPLWQRYSYQVEPPLNAEAMDRACHYLAGKHDFASFASRVEAKLKNTVRTVYQAEVKRKGVMVIFRMAADSFLPHQIRNTVGALVRIGLGKMNDEEFYSIIEAKKFGLAGPAAPSRGLCLVKINYDASWSIRNEDR